MANLINAAAVALASLAAPVLSSAGSHSAPATAPSVLTVGVLGDYGWTGWNPAPLEFCNNVLPQLEAKNISIPTEVVNDCDSGDRASVANATALQADTAAYIGNVCGKKKCSAFISVGDNFYDSGVDFTTGGIIRFTDAWVNMYQGGVYDNTTWYQCLGNHDVVKGQSGVDFETKIAPLYDSRWYFGTEGLPYYTYDLQGADFSATFVVLDSDCFLNKYQESSSVYYTEYTQECFKQTQTQADFLQQSFSQSKADWKFVQLHHPYLSSSSNYTELWPLIEIVEQHGGVVLNGHDHCLGHYVGNNTNFILSGGAGYTQAGDCNNGVALGPFAKYLAANAESAANGFVTLDITKTEVNVEYYVRDMTFEGGDLYPVKNDLEPSYSFTITNQAH